MMTQSQAAVTPSDHALPGSRGPPRGPHARAHVGVHAPGVAPLRRTVLTSWAWEQTPGAETAAMRQLVVTSDTTEAAPLTVTACRVLCIRVSRFIFYFLLIF